VELPLPLTRRSLVVGAAVLLALLAVSGRHIAQAGAASSPEAVVPAAAALTAEEAEPAGVVVHVVGAVRQPGLYELAEGSRVSDALARAGGPTARADLERINLASPVADGLQVLVPRRAPPGAPAGGAPAATRTGGAAGGPVHLNSATVEELETLPGVGPATAQKIVAHREKHGAFRSVEELEAVSGIGPKRIEQLRDHVAP
jgi:competence protein ComEA